ncbi:MAG: 6-bladed beta-propeller [Gemmatimonadaceae bacterium]
MTAMRRRLLASLGALVAVMPLYSPSAQATRDSAGVQIVLNDRPSLPAAKAWRVAPAPLLSIGAGSPIAAGDSLYEFYLVYGMARLSDGRIVVGVQSTHTVRIFDAKGKFVGSFGRKGKGPGEFQQIMGVHHTRGDTLAITDLGEIEWYSGQGKFVRPGAGRGRGANERFQWPMAYLADGSYVSIDGNEPVIPPAGRRVRLSPLVVVRDDGAKLTQLARLPSGEEVFDGRNQWGQRVQYAPYGLVASDGERIYSGFGTTYRIDVRHADGTLLRSIRRAHTPTPVTEVHKRAWVAHVMKSPGEHAGVVSREAEEATKRVLAAQVYANTLPAFGSLLTDRSQHLWVQHYDPLIALLTPGPARVQTIANPTRWDVFDRNGRWLTTVELPARFTPQEIGADYVLGVARNEDDEEGVRMYRLVKP